MSGMGDFRMKSPRDPRDMWKKPDLGDKNSDSDGPEIVTKVRQVLDFEIFETDAPDIDFDELNQREAEQAVPEQSAQKDEKSIELIVGQDLIVEEISTS